MIFAAPQGIFGLQTSSNFPAQLLVGDCKLSGALDDKLLEPFVESPDVRLRLPVHR